MGEHGTTTRANEASGFDPAVDESESALDTWAICSICQQPVRHNRSVRWHGSPVHRECFSELK